MRHVRHSPTLTKQERKELEGALSALPTLQGCDAAEVHRLARTGTALKVPPAWTLVQEGTPGDSCYLLISGEVVVSHAKEQVAVLRPGALFGEVGMLDARLRTATVTARTATRVLRLSYADLQPLLTSEPHLAEALLADYRRRSGASTA